MPGAGPPPLPATPETVALYLTALAEAGRRASTLQRRLSTISQAHQAAGHEPPTRSAAVRAVWAGIRRARGTAQEGKAPAVTADFRAMVAALPDTLLGQRDRALLLVGFAGAMRRSELVGLDVQDAQFTREGLIVTIRRSKTDPEGQGQTIGIPYGSNPATSPSGRLRIGFRPPGSPKGPSSGPSTATASCCPGASRIRPSPWW